MKRCALTNLQLRGRSGVTQALLHDYGYFALILILTLDASGVPWPTEATLVMAGVAFGEGGWLKVLLAGLSSLGGAALGSAFSYYLGRRMGPALMRRIMAFFRLSNETMDKVDAWFEKYGHRAVFFGRMIPFVRNFTGFPAGVMGMHFGQYMLYSLAGYSLYIAFALSLGYGGASFARWVGDAEIVLAILLPLAAIVLWFKYGRKWVAKRRGM